MENENILKRLVRLGTVTDVNTGERKARVKYQDCSMTSGWLYVLDNRPGIPTNSGTQETETEDGHKHTLTVIPWMPKVNDTVVVLYLPIFNGDGFVLGGI